MSVQEENTKQLLTFVIPSRNNAEFLRLAYNSIRSLERSHYILVLDDLSEDETVDLIVGWTMTDDMFNSYLNPGKERLGIVGLFDIGIAMAKTDYIVAFHADMICSPNFDKNILKHLKKGTVVCGTRVEPPLHPSGPEKITKDLGNDWVDFDPIQCTTELGILETEHKDKTTNGIFAPWACHVDDYMSIGGHDSLFAPQSKEDSDLFNRMFLSGYNLIQAWDALVYHFTCRGSRFNPSSGGGIGKDSPEWIATNKKSYKNFIRKWGRPVTHDEFMMPIVKMKYDIGLAVKNINLVALEDIEPYFSNIYTDTNCNDYILAEQKNTTYNLELKIRPYDSKKINDIVVHIENDSFFSETTKKVSFLISEILDTINEPGSFTIPMQGGGDVRVDVFYLMGYEYDNLKK
jgi:glycosyltransferase involved in cell wall biosynthesis